MKQKLHKDKQVPYLCIQAEPVSDLHPGFFMWVPVPYKNVFIY